MQRTETDVGSSSAPLLLPSNAIFSPYSFAAGCVAGGAGQFLGYPLDTLKVMAQTKSLQAITPSMVSSSSSSSTSRQHFASFTRLFRGVTAPVIFSGVNTSIILGVYENVRLNLRDRYNVHEEEPTPLDFIGLSGLAAGLTATGMLCPQSRVKVMQQLEGGSWRDTVVKLSKEGE
jgi:hypothetical protein